MQQLPPHQYLSAYDLEQEIIEYHYINEYPAELIAQETGFPLSDILEILDRAMDDSDLIELNLD